MKNAGMFIERDYRTNNQSIHEEGVSKSQIAAATTQPSIIMAAASFIFDSPSLWMPSGQWMHILAMQESNEGLSLWDVPPPKKSAMLFKGLYLILYVLVLLLRNTLKFFF